MNTLHTAEACTLTQVSACVLVVCILRARADVGPLLMNAVTLTTQIITNGFLNFFFQSFSFPVHSNKSSFIPSPSIHPLLPLMD